MVIGADTKAKRFAEFQLRDDVVIFCDDVARSEETDPTLFAKEEQAILSAKKMHPGKLFVYLSSTSLLSPESPSSPYVLHRQKMEALILREFNNCLIVRVPQIVGLLPEEGGLFNHLFSSIKNETPLNVWSKAERSFLDIDDLFFMVYDLIEQGVRGQQTVTLANPYFTRIATAVEEIETFTKRKARVTTVDNGEPLKLDLELSKSLAVKLGLQFGSGYLRKLLQKYYQDSSVKRPLLSVVVPTYFEEKGIVEFYRRTKNVLLSLQHRYSYEFIFVNDGSTDGTLAKLKEIQQADSQVNIVNFSRNFGNQYAITAGLDRAVGDLIVIIDDDLQDPPEIILNFIAKWWDGYKVVYGVRQRRDGINPVFDYIAKFYYRALDKISDIKIPVDTGDFRLIDRSVADNLKLIHEENRFFRGFVAWVGFSQFGWKYRRDARYAGHTTFTLKKYISFAFTGLTGFSEKPLYFASYFGFLVTAVGFIYAVTIIYQKFFIPGFSIQGWPSLVSLIVFFGGLQSLFTGIVGIYLGKIYKQVKQRPLYIVESEYGFKNRSTGQDQNKIQKDQ